VAIAHWHPGKLVLVWVLCLLAALLAYAVADSETDSAFQERAAVKQWNDVEAQIQQLEAGIQQTLRIPGDSARRIVARWRDSVARTNLDTGDPRTVAAYHKFRTLALHSESPPSTRHARGWVLALSVMAFLFLAPFAITWRWFGARERNRHST
jgi:hypothetical protein